MLVSSDRTTFLCHFPSAKENNVCWHWKQKIYTCQTHSASNSTTLLVWPLWWHAGFLNRSTQTVLNKSFVLHIDIDRAVAMTTHTHCEVHGPELGSGIPWYIASSGLATSKTCVWKWCTSIEVIELSKVSESNSKMGFGSYNNLRIILKNAEIPLHKKIKVLIKEFSSFQTGKLLPFLPYSYATFREIPFHSTLDAPVSIRGGAHIEDVPPD